jgi:threonine dehydrogenase-like Zn-dependent dehydrogenase
MVRNHRLTPWFAASWYKGDFEISIFARGALKTDGLIKTTFKLEEWEKAFDYATGKYGDFKGEAVGAQMGTPDIQFFPVPDD